MIKVKYWFNGRYIDKLEVKGHAGYDKSGKDLICAGVSCIMFGLLNAIDNEVDNASINQGENDIIISLEEYDQKVQDYMELVIVQLETIAESYPEYIKLERKLSS